MNPNYKENSYYFIKINDKWVISIYFSDYFHYFNKAFDSACFSFKYNTEVGDEVKIPSNYSNYIVGNYWFKRNYGDWIIIFWDGEHWNINNNKYNIDFVNIKDYTLGNYIPYPEA
jgi:hypothetical protein